MDERQSSEVTESAGWVASAVNWVVFLLLAILVVGVLMLLELREISDALN